MMDLFVVLFVENYSNVTTWIDEKSDPCVLFI